MIREIVHSLIALAFMFALLFGVAVLTGCAETKYIVKCTLTQPENCN